MDKEIETTLFGVLAVMILLRHINPLESHMRLALALMLIFESIVEGLGGLLALINRKES